MERLRGAPLHRHRLNPRGTHACRDALRRHLDAALEGSHPISGDPGGRCGRTGVALEARRHADRVAPVSDGADLLKQAAVERFELEALGWRSD
jgi:hypothetical protein